MLKNLTIRQRLRLGFGALLSLLLLTALAGWLGSRQLGAQMAGVRSDAALLQLLGTVRAEVLNLRRYEKDLFLNAASPERQVEYAGKWLRAYELALDAVGRTRPLLEAAGDAGPAAAMTDDLAAYRRGFEDLQRQLRDGSIKDPAEANAAMLPGKDAVRRVTDVTVPQLAEQHAARLAKAEEDADRLERLVALGMVFLVLVAALSSVVIARAITASVIEPIHRVMKVAEAISARDLTARIGNGSQDEAGQLLATMDSMSANLREMIGETRAGAHELATAAAQILATSRRTVAGAQNQAAAVQETTSSAAELQQTVRVTEERAREIQEVMTRTVRSNQSLREQLSDAATMLGRVREEMQAIVANVQNLAGRNLQIGEIIESVGNVADQTQLLAVNAGIEAAKAGDVGRGFSVVASEMKALADQTKKASQRIRQIVGEVQQAAGDTARVVETGQARLQQAIQPVSDVLPMVEALTAQVDESHHSLRQILSIVSQQVVGIAQITQAMRTVQAAVQDGLVQNQELERSAEGVNILGQGLRELVADYRI